MLGLMRTAFALSALSIAFAGSAHALNARTWISGKGSDQAGCGPVANPCRTLQFAHDNTSAGGEIDVLDPAGYGAVTITKSISIINEGGIAGVLAAAGGNAITINTGYGDAVVLRGLTVEGAKVGANGIVFTDGSALTIANCVVQGFVGTGNAGNGIWIKHSSGSSTITITDTTASYNDYVGIVYSPTGAGGGQFSISRTIVSHNGYGLSVYGGDTTNNISAAVTGTQALNNKSFGFQFWGYPSRYSFQVMDAHMSHSVAYGNHPGITLGNYVLLDISDVIARQNVGVDIVGYGGNAFLQGDGTNAASKSNVNSQSTTRF